MAGGSAHAVNAAQEIANSNVSQNIGFVKKLNHAWKLVLSRLLKVLMATYRFFVFTIVNSLKKESYRMQFREFYI